MLLAEKAKSRQNNINLIQFAAAILVIYNHAFPIATAGNNGEVIMGLTQSRYSTGNLAVAIFFIFSGYLVCSSWERSQSLYAYARNRFYRIFPELGGGRSPFGVNSGACVHNASSFRVFCIGNDKDVF